MSPPTLTSRPPSGPRELRRTEWLPLALLLGGGLLLAGLRFNDTFPLNGDNADYLLLARNLVTGRPYDNAGFPWGYPLLLAPGVALFGPSNLLAAVPWLKGFSVAGFLLALAWLYLLFRTRHSRLIAGLTVGLFAVNDIALYYTNDLLTEMPYLAATAAALLYWQRRIDPAQGLGVRDWGLGVGDATAERNTQQAIRNPQSAFGWVFAALLLTLPYYLRSIGLALLGAPPLVLLWRRRWRAAVLLALALAILAAPWAIFSVATDPNRNYTSAFWLIDPYHPELGQITFPAGLLARIGERVTLYSQTVLPTMLLPQPADPAGPLRQIGGGLLLLAVLGGYVLRLVKRVELPEIYVLGFLVILCSWWWNGDRFLLPVLPFLLHYVAEALLGILDFGFWIWDRLRRGATRGRQANAPATVALQNKSQLANENSKLKTQNSKLKTAPTALVLALLLLPPLAQDRLAIAQNLSYWGGDVTAAGLAPEDRAFLTASIWLHDHTPPDSVILARKPSIAEVYSGRTSVLIPLIPPDQFLTWLGQHQITYVLEDSFLWSVHTTDHLRPALGLFAAHFRLLDTIPPPAPADPPTRVWQFTP